MTKFRNPDLNVIKFRKKSAGFSLIELLVVVGILVAISIAVFINVGDYAGGQNIKLSGEELLSVVRSVQKRSISQEDGKQWGIRFTNTTSGSPHKYEVFSGSVFTTSGIDRLYTLKRGVRFGEPFVSSTYDMGFSPITGRRFENKIISLITGAKDSLVYDIVVRSFGNIVGRNEKGVVGYWHFDENNGISTNDTSPTGINGVISGATWQPSSNCRAGNCLNFNGANNYITVNNSNYLNPAHITAEGWFYTSNRNANQRIISKTEAGGYQISLNENSSCPLSTLCLLLYVNGVGFRAASYPVTNISNDVWYHVAGTYDGLNIKLYLNGAQVATTTQAGSGVLGVTAPLCIGSEAAPGNCSAGGSFFSGRIDEARIYNRALSNEEIGGHYNDLK